MIEQGIKKEEYREIKPYWDSRLKGRFYDTVTFVYGYTKKTMTFKSNGTYIQRGKPEWGAEPYKLYYVIKIGERIQ